MLVCGYLINVFCYEEVYFGIILYFGRVDLVFNMVVVYYILVLVFRRSFEFIKFKFVYWRVKNDVG